MPTFYLQGPFIPELSAEVTLNKAQEESSISQWDSQKQRAVNKDIDLASLQREDIS